MEFYRRAKRMPLGDTPTTLWLRSSLHELIDLAIEDDLDPTHYEVSHCIVKDDTGRGFMVEHVVTLFAEAGGRAEVRDFKVHHTEEPMKPAAIFRSIHE